MLTEYHLRGKHHSGRAVRVKTLDPSESEQVLTAAAKLVGPEATILELKKVEWRNGVKQFIVSFSDPCEDPRTLEPKAWKKVAPGMLDDPGQFFTPKDMGVLEAIYREFHEVSANELEQITGKALSVSED